MPSINDLDFMQQAIATSIEAIDRGQIPVGAVLVRDGKVLAVTHNTVWSDCDPTAHAEMNAIRVTAQQLRSVDLAGCTVYCTLEPCPMCLSACHWARVSRIVYGADIADAVRAGFSELTIPAVEMVRLGHSPMRIEGGLMANECRDLFRRWLESGKAKTY